ncbi:hypothetical protein JXA48_02050 [Candidatus Woesearchaeota archaeon]|nr:hypothetical protein [Candidatus Woesearchaeota archaeon]
MKIKTTKTISLITAIILFIAAIIGLMNSNIGKTTNNENNQIIINGINNSINTGNIITQTLLEENITEEKEIKQISELRVPNNEP